MRRVLWIIPFAIGGTFVGCGSVGTQSTISPATSDINDTLAETSVLLFQWVNTTNTKVEFDFTVDANDAQHVEMAPSAVVNLRLTGECPDNVLFSNIQFGDEYFAGIIPFEQSNVASEGDLAGESGTFMPAQFFCFSSWQLVVNNSDITVAALDRQANSVDEGETATSDLFSNGADQTNPPPRSDTSGAGDLNQGNNPDPSVLSGPGGGAGTGSNDPNNNDNSGDNASGIGSIGDGKVSGPGG